MASNLLSTWHVPTCGTVVYYCSSSYTCKHSVVTSLVCAWLPSYSLVTLLYTEWENVSYHPTYNCTIKVVVFSQEYGNDSQWL